MKMRNTHFLLVCLLLAACTLQQSGSGSPQAWIDAPLDGSVLPLAPYEIIVHGAAPASPSAMELTINGQAVDIESNSSGSGLKVARYKWTPMAPGRYEISVRTLDTAQHWSDPHTHIVTVVGDIITPTPVITVTVSPTVTPVITVTVSPTVTLTPTLTPTLTATPTAVPAGELTISFLGASTDKFYFNDKSCGPVAVTLEVQVSDPQRVRDMFVFYKLRDMDTGHYTDWNDGTSMRSQGSGKFSLTLQSKSISPIEGRENYLIYQFVASGANNQPVARTPVYSDIVLSGCGRFIISPP